MGMSPSERGCVAEEGRGSLLLLCDVCASRQSPVFAEGVVGECVTFGDVDLRAMTSKPMHGERGIPVSCYQLREGALKTAAHGEALFIPSLFVTQTPYPNGQRAENSS